MAWEFDTCLDFVLGKLASVWKTKQRVTCAQDKDDHQHQVVPSWGLWGARTPPGKIRDMVMEAASPTQAHSAIILRSIFL